MHKLIQRLCTGHAVTILSRINHDCNCRGESLWIADISVFVCVCVWGGGGKEEDGGLGQSWKIA